MQNVGTKDSLLASSSGNGRIAYVRLTLKQIIITNSGKNMKEQPFEVTGDLPKLKRNWRGFNPRKKGISLKSFFFFP